MEFLYDMIRFFYFLFKENFESVCLLFKVIRILFSCFLKNWNVLHNMFRGINHCRYRELNLSCVVSIRRFIVEAVNCNSRSVAVSDWTVCPSFPPPPSNGRNMLGRAYGKLYTITGVHSLCLLTRRAVITRAWNSCAVSNNCWILHKFLIWVWLVQGSGTFNYSFIWIWESVQKNLFAFERFFLLTLLTSTISVIISVNTNNLFQDHLCSSYRVVRFISCPLWRETCLKSISGSPLYGEHWTFFNRSLGF